MKPTPTPPPDQPAPLLAFGAHPDDIEFGCGGVIARETQSGRPAHFVICSRGESGTNGTPAERTAEAEKSAALLGATCEFIDLGGVRLAGTAKLLGAGFRGLVAAQRGLAIEILRDGVAHRQRRERRAGVVQVSEPRHFRCLGAPAGEVGVVGWAIHRKAPTISSSPLVQRRSSNPRAAARSPRRRASAMRP